MLYYCCEDNYEYVTRMVTSSIPDTHDKNIPGKGHCTLRKVKMKNRLFLLGWDFWSNKKKKSFFFPLYFFNLFSNNLVS